MNHLELLKKYVAIVVDCVDSNELGKIAFDIGTSDELSDSEKGLLMTIITEADDV